MTRIFSYKERQVTSSSTYHDPHVYRFSKLSPILTIKEQKSLSEHVKTYSCASEEEEEEEEDKENKNLNKMFFSSI